MQGILCFDILPSLSASSPSHYSSSTGSTFFLPLPTPSLLFLHYPSSRLPTLLCLTSKPFSLSPSYQYKYPEGTDWERRALYNGYKELLVEVHDVEFFIQETEYEFGQDVTLVVTMSNKARQHRVRGKIQCQAVTYTGK